jgi:HEPN domain-containing protein
MAERAKDWFRQAEADLRHARGARNLGHYDWSAFASQQAAEKAIKALYQHLHMEAWGHVLTELLRELPDEIKPDEALIGYAKQLDKNYIPTRYPNGFERGAPVDFYTEEDAMAAIAHAEAVVEFCRNKIG